MNGQINDQGVDQGVPQPEASPLHRPFSWLHTDKPHRGADFIESVVDMCAGVQTCLQLVHSTDMALHARTWGDDDQPVLGVVDRERLLRLAIAVTGVLAEGTHQEIEWVNNHARTQAPGKESGR